MSRVAVGQAADRLRAGQLAELHAGLEQQRRFRVSQIAELTAGDRVPATSEVDEQLLAGARFALAQIDAALDRMRQGRYGTCEGCGGRIPFARLEVLPMVPLCVGCQRASDRVAGHWT